MREMNGGVFRWLNCCRHCFEVEFVRAPVTYHTTIMSMVLGVTKAVEKGSTPDLPGVQAAELSTIEIGGSFCFCGGEEPLLSSWSWSKPSKRAVDVAGKFSSSLGSEGRRREFCIVLWLSNFL